jgi:hypothetical protein
MTTGIVKWFNDAKGFGFITPMAEARICSHIFPRSGWRQLQIAQGKPEGRLSTSRLDLRGASPNIKPID